MDPAARPAARAVAKALEPGPLLVSLATLGIVAAQLAFRGADDNRLVSWAWVFARTEPVRLFALVAAGIALAHAAAHAAFPHRRPALTLSLLAFAAGACAWGVPEPIVDASRYFAQAKHLEVHGLRGFLSAWGREIPAWTDLPLVPALYGVTFALLGESRLPLQVLTTILFSGTVLLVQRTGAALWDEDVGSSGAAFLLAIPYLVTQVPAVLVDVPTMFFVTLAVFATVRAVQAGGAGRIVLAAVAIPLALLSKYSAGLLLTGLPAIPVVLRRTPGALRRFSAVALAAGLLLLAAVLLQRDVLERQVALLLSYQAPGLRRWGESFLSTFLFQVHPFLTAAALLSAWVAFRRRDARWIVVAWPLVLLLALEVRRIRYLLPAFPMAALLAAHGLQALRDLATRRLVVACAVASSLVVALYGQVPFLRSTSASNLKAAGAYLDGVEERVVEVHTPPVAGATVNPAVSVPILDLFTGKPLRYDYEPPPPEVVRAARESPLRFTWEYRNPGWYASGAPAGPAAVAVVSADLDAPFPEALARRLAPLRLARTFAADEGVFEHRTFVRVYREADASSSSPDGR